jgi:hypothetical protein
MKKTLMGLAVAAALGMSPNASAASYLDLFLAEDFAIDDTPGGTAVASSTSDCASILGCEREISANYISGDGGSFDRSIMVVEDSKLSFSNDEGVRGEGVVQWDGAADLGSMTIDPDGLGGINLWAFGDGFLVEVIATDLDFDLWINAYTDDDEFTKTRVRTTGPETLFIPFANLETCDNPGGPVQEVICGGAGGDQPADLKRFGAAELIINPGGGTVSVDLSIGPITMIPEPTTLSLLGLGLLGAAATGLRRRKAAKTA